MKFQYASLYFVVEVKEFSMFISNYFQFSNGKPHATFIHALIYSDIDDTMVVFVGLACSQH